MRIERIELKWFRGAADQAVLKPNGKSVVVYGQNGSGKSSFVDAFEYVLRGGKIDHLAHEYSGTRQEKAVPNTHKPSDQNAALSIDFKDGAKVTAQIDNNGASRITGAEVIGLDDWAYQRTILRQHEVSDFIHRRKGEKYSALLPLLGLTPLEHAAENLRKLAKAVEEQAQIAHETVSLKKIADQRQETFGDATDEQIREIIQGLHGQYCPEISGTTEPVQQCEQLVRAIEQRLSQLTRDQRRHDHLMDASRLEIKGQIAEVRRANAQIAKVTETLINEKLQVLNATDSYVAKIDEGTEHIDCPSCGRAIPVEDFHQHVESEKERLYDIRGASEQRDAAIRDLCQSVISLKQLVKKPELESWREQQIEDPFPDAIAYLDKLDPEALRKSYDEDALANLELYILPIVDAAAKHAKQAPPEAHQLNNDKTRVATARETFNATRRRTAVERANALIAYIQTLEQKVRDELSRQANTVISDISSDVQQMWSVLHPNAAIENIHLSMPKDKAIDIRLRFHGVEQDSPCLTLSEGYRNALGLCIFLAMAKREAGQDRPLVLDDVVVSMDRPHRGMVAGLLEQEFSSRQVILLTHDRTWYTELRRHLDGKIWEFNPLLPYDEPTTGIRWASGGNIFADARASLQDRPDTAGNDARKHMDTELAIIAEKLQIELPFRRDHKNDLRGALEFGQKLASDGKRCFQKKVNGEYETHQDAIDAIKQANTLIVTWANRSSHTFDIVRSEAEKLINACEQALFYFKCADCGKDVWAMHADNGKLAQCVCGTLRWRYGKG